MYKIIGIVAVLAVGYALFFQDPSPDVIYFNGYEFGSKKLDRSNDSNSTVYHYFSRSISNDDTISVVYPDADTSTPSEWSDFFSKGFERQGYKFSEEGMNKIGVNGSVKLFMKPSYEKNVLFVYMLDDINNADHLDESKVFQDLAAISLD